MAKEDYFRRVQQETPTQLFCDISDIPSLQRAVDWGAVGAASNPPRVSRAVRSDPQYWQRQVEQMITTHPKLPDEDLADMVTQSVVKQASEILMPVYRRTKGQKGYQAIQGNPHKYADLDILISSAKRYAKIAPNVAVKIPIHAEGLQAIEELAAEGVNLVATTGYSVAQCMAAAEAHSKGLKRDTDSDRVSRCIVVIVTGRLDAHFSDLLAKENLTVPETLVDQAGMAVTKNIYRLFQRHNLPSMLLAAGARKHRHFTDYVGGRMGVLLGPPLQEELVKSDPPVTVRIDDFPSEKGIDELREKLPDFRQAYDEDGLTVPEMRAFGPCVKLEEYFLGGFADLLEFIDSCRK